MSDDYLIMDDKGVIETHTHLSDAETAFNEAPSPSIPAWEGDLVLVHRLAVKR